MEKFVIINGSTIIVKEFASRDDAHTYAVNYSDHSKEVILRSFEEFALTPKAEAMASVIFNTDERTIKEQVLAILASKANPLYTNIDHIDDVQVCEACENRYTISGFLDMMPSDFTKTLK